ncbi:hypothetical protein DZC34_09090, partial [Clostridium botulinum]
MNIFYLLPISISYFEINDIEEQQLKEEYKKFISNIERMDYTDLKEEDFVAKIILDLFSISFRVDKEI